MTREQIVATLRSHHADMRQQFGVVSLSIFGSASRDELRSGSDIDILVAFDGPATADRYFGLKSYLEEILGRPVDLATEKMFKPGLRKRVGSEMLRVA